MIATPLRRVLAIAAATLGLLAAFAGSPYRAPRDRIDVGELASIVAHEGDHVTAVELGEWIRDRKAGLRVIDLRTPEEFEAGRVPTSENVALESLASMPRHDGETIVLISGGGAHAAQAWVFLRALGARDVYFLRGGAEEWVEEVLHPAIPSNPPPAEAARVARIAALSRYFGGSPHVVTEDGSAARNGRATREEDGGAARNGRATRGKKDETTARWRRGC